MKYNQREYFPDGGEKVPPQSNASEPNQKDQKPMDSEEQREFHDRLSTIIRNISRKYNLEVSSRLGPHTYLELLMRGQNPDQVWFREAKMDPKTRKTIAEYVHIPSAILESSENVAKGKAAHEASHSVITRYGEFVPDAVMAEVGFPSLMASVEERATDHFVRVNYPGAGEWVDEAREDNIQQTPVTGITARKRPYIPKFQQLSNILVHGRQYAENIPDYYDEEVIRLYRELESEVEIFENTLPHEGSPEEEARQKAEERYKLVYQKLWPKVRELLDADKEEQELRQMLGQLQKQKESNGEEGSPLESLLKEFPDELASLLPSEAPLSESDEKIEPSEVLKAAIEAGKSQREMPEDLKKELADIKRKIDQREKERLMPKLGQKMSDSLKQTLKAIFDKLPHNVKKQLMDAAIETLKRMEDRLLKQLAPKLVDMPPETHAQRKEREVQRKERERTKKPAKEKKERREQERVKKGMDKIERRIVASEADSGVYDKTYREIFHLDQKLYREFEEIFIPNIKPTMKLKSSGMKPNLPAIFRWEALRNMGLQSIDNRIWESVHHPEKRDYAFTLLNDLSGSMMIGDKIIEDFKAKVLFTEVFNRIGIPFEVLGFQDEVIIFKKHDERVTDAVRERLSGMLGEVTDDNPGGHNRAQYNDDGPCLLTASQSLDSLHAKHKFLIVFSDGVPEGRRSGEQDLHDAVKSVLQKRTQNLLAVGIGPDTEHVTKFYPNALPNVDVKKLADIVGEVLKDMILFPEKYVYSNFPLKKRNNFFYH
jgi:hypothetical protein